MKNEVKIMPKYLLKETQVTWKAGLFTYFPMVYKD